MGNRFIEGLREFFRQLRQFRPLKNIKLEVELPLTLDLSKYHNSLGYFFEEVVALNKENPDYQALKKLVVYIGTSDEHPGTPDVLEVAFDERHASIQAIQEALRKIGIRTKPKV